MFINRLSKVYKHFGKIARKAEISCYRIYDLDLPEFPFAIDIYENHVYVAEYKRNHNLNDEEYNLWMSDSIKVIAEVLEVPLDNIHVKQRRIIEDRKHQYSKSSEAGQDIIVSEGGLKFMVNLDQYLDTGLFLDHRITRSMVKDLSEGKKVLNLFAYTGAFSVYAAAGKAEEVLTIDLSNTYVEWAKKNMILNGFDDIGKYKYQAVDVLAIVPRLPKKHFDIIVLDPPTFSNSRKMKTIFDMQLNHVKLINECLDILDIEGTIFFSTNFTKFKIDTIEIQGDIKDITRQTLPFDFQKTIRLCYRIRHKKNTPMT